MKYLGLALALTCTALTPLAAMADGPSCKTINLADIGWTDNEVQNAVFSALVSPLGYTVSTNLYSEEVMYAGMKSGKIDVFLDDWTPSMDSETKPYEDAKQIDVYGPDLTGAKYTLVVPTYLYKAGLHSFADIHKFGKQLDYKMYGIEPGNDGNEHMLDMIKNNKFGLGKFSVVQSSEAGMLSEVARKYPGKKAIVFLGWEPEPMNVTYSIQYLSGGDAYFGPNEGEATIYVNTRSGYGAACPNVTKVLKQFFISVENENAMMYSIQIKNQKPADVAATWLAAHQPWAKKTLAGVTNFDGTPAAL